jgi:hypothetical protein
VGDQIVSIIYRSQPLVPGVYTVNVAALTLCGEAHDGG